jgi:uncharacterized membrane protein
MSPGPGGRPRRGSTTRGEIVGCSTYGRRTPAAQAEHGFLYNGNRFRRINVPGATETRALGINNQSEIVGEYVDRAGASHGFVREPDGEVTSLDVPGAEGTVAIDIDDQGRVVGAYSDEETQSIHGFLRGTDGTVTTIDHPQALYPTVAQGINESGLIVGRYIDSRNIVHGFVRGRRVANHRGRPRRQRG